MPKMPKVSKIKVFCLSYPSLPYALCLNQLTVCTSYPATRNSQPVPRNA